MRNKTYKGLDLVKRLGPNKLWYLIPSDWILKDSKRGKSEAIVGKDCYVHCLQFARLLNESTGRTPQGWYDTFVLGISTPDDRPKCTQCGKPLKFVSIKLGYCHIPPENMANEDNLFCSRRCTITYVSSHTEEYPVFDEFHKNGQAAGMMLANPDKYPEWNEYMRNGSGYGLCARNPEKYGLIGFKNKETHKKQSIEGCFTRFLQMGDSSDPCEFYIASTTTGLKFGISSNSNLRLELADNYLRIKVLFKSSRLAVASVERFIKYELNQGHEYVSWKKTSKFRKAYLKALRIYEV